ncbi:MAG TPA: tRNA (adenine-N1)-methyltransferase [Streptosporangiaceae bacterium]|nr:tRNA (adenine-N1)-methyltransferase [Streptosporangiaceae bacterium]
MIRQRRGPFVPGDQVQLTDPKGRKHLVVLQPGKSFHTHRGSVAHDDLIGSPEGSVVKSSGGTPYVALRPLLADFTLAMSRGAAVIYPKDAAQIIAMADIFPGARVLEAGAGSGALSCWLLRAVGDSGLLVSYERRADFADIARQNVERFFGGPHPAWQLRTGDLSELDLPGPDEASMDEGGPDLPGPDEAGPDEAGPDEAGPDEGGPDEAGPDVAAVADEDGPAVIVREEDGGAAAEGQRFDRVVLDLVAPWEHTGAAARALIPGGLICCYLATVTQLSRTVEAIREQGSFDEPSAWETLIRGWHADGLAVRPEHRMIGHTGFLVTARRLAAGTVPPPRRRRPAKGAHEPQEGS